MLYLFAVAVGLGAAGLALILPVWLREGRAGVLRQSGRIAPTLGIILVMLLAIVWATNSRLDVFINPLFASLSTIAAASLLVWDRFPAGQRTLMRSLILLALVLLILVLGLGLIRVVQGT